MAFVTYVLLGGAVLGTQHRSVGGVRSWGRGSGVVLTVGVSVMKCVSVVRMGSAVLTVGVSVVRMGSAVY